MGAGRGVFLACERQFEHARCRRHCAPVRPGDRLTTSVVGADTTFLSTSPAIVHAGLGDARSLSELTVRWPVSGRVSVLHDVAADRTVSVEKPA